MNDKGGHFMAKKQQSFIEGATILMSASIIVKLIGALFKIPLTSILGGSGMGYYMTAYGIFNPVYALTVAGFAISVSKLTAKYPAAEQNKILRAALLTFLPVGFVMSGVMLMNSQLFCTLLENPDAWPAVGAIAPAVFFSSVASILRGHFEGRRMMTPTAVSQVAEAVIKLFAGIYMAGRVVVGAKQQFLSGGSVYGIAATTLEQAIELSAPRAAAAALAGVTLATAISAIVMLFFWGSEQKAGPSKGFSQYIPKLIDTALPVCMTALVINISSLIDLYAIMKRLNLAVQRGLHEVIACYPQANLQTMPPEKLPNFLFGCYTGLSMTLFNLIPALTASVAVCALPMITSLYYRKERQALAFSVTMVLKITAVVAAPAGFGLFALAEPILQLLFRNNTTEIAVAAGLLKLLCLSAFFVALTAPLFAMLQAVGRPYVPVKLMLVGTAAKLVVNHVLVARPSVNIMGAPIGMAVCYVFLCVGALYALVGQISLQVNLLSLFARPLLAGFLCATIAKTLYLSLLQHSNSPLILLISIACAAFVYLFLLIILRVFKKQEVNLLLQRQKFANTIAKDKTIR